MDNEVLSLYDLNSLVRGVLQDGMAEMYWIRAETSDVRPNQNGHCYLEFIEKNEVGKTVIARARGMIWSNTFFLLREYFESATKQPFVSGLKVLVKVSVEFHELYGFSLTVHDIDPSYTLGDQARNRTVILQQLEEDGVLDLNKELELPIPTNRIAIISSPTAAGYDDFCNQLSHNAYGFTFYTKLFPAIMQGDRAENSIIEALERIYINQDKFDVVVIIRGGGATSELSCFDSYLLAASCVQFPLPIITGIGHERDETVLDMVAHTRTKTPTAVAEFLITNMSQIVQYLNNIESDLVDFVNQKIQNEITLLSSFQVRTSLSLKHWQKIQSNFLSVVKDQFSNIATRVTRQEHLLLENKKKDLEQSVDSVIQQKRECLSSVHNDLSQRPFFLLSQKLSELKNMEKYIELISPQNILKKGYTLTLKDGKLLKNQDVLKQGDTITTKFATGEIKSVVK